MAKRDQLRKLRTGTVINKTSGAQEKDIDQALRKMVKRLRDWTPVALLHEKQWKLHEIVSHLSKHFPEVDFHCHFKTSSVRPDGGIVWLVTNDKERFPIVISEVKNQGTNDLRKKEGKSKQAKGNAIERLGKNVIAFRAVMRSESIFPFVCFGYGCDFESGSSILDRVSTVSIFAKLNQTHLHAEGPNNLFNRGSFYFRPNK